MGTEERPESENEGRCVNTSSRSRDPSLSTEGIVKNCCTRCVVPQWSVVAGLRNAAWNATRKSAWLSQSFLELRRCSGE